MKRCGNKEVTRCRLTCPGGLLIRVLTPRRGGGGGDDFN